VVIGQTTIIIIVVLASASRLVAVIRFMITARQSRAARALLGWKQETLADKAQVSLTALRRLESESGLRVYESTRDQVRRALEGNGIVFMSTEKGEGVMIMRGSNALDDTQFS
jgi:ribosomal protein S8